MNRTGLSTSLAVVVVAASAFVTGCGSKDQTPAQQPQANANGYYGQQPGAYPQQPGAYPQQPGAYPQQPGAYPQQPGAYPQQPGAQPGAQPGTAPAASGGLQIPGFPPAGGGGTASGGTAQAIDPNLAALATGPLGMFANTEAPGMAKDGPILAGNFQEGQTLEGTFTFQPGKCYTLLATGAGISALQVEMQYVTPLPGLAPSIGKSSQTGSQVSIGGKANCLRPLSPFPANAKFIVRANKGAGLAAAQLYSK
ncbi:hypothetical protein AKJ09_07582 [Labilithrix luteola]|uniref:Uncharacterized protein n=1 Tax=Labilithrix luteola TaxID=1391654 RepID=A0A0K1Q5C1_9BACT|nr:hypothetical protein [Labilithrix luteola]AKV00919.1 hypothetical protein AKJ09_07582 [Labilithrix luteola]